MKKRLISFMLLITVISCFGFNTDYFKNLLTLISQAAKEVIPEVPHEHIWEYNGGKPKRN